MTFFFEISQQQISNGILDNSTGVFLFLDFSVFLPLCLRKLSRNSKNVYIGQYTRHVQKVKTVFCSGTQENRNDKVGTVA